MRPRKMHFFCIVVCFFIRKSQQSAVIKRLSFFVVAGLTAMYVFIRK